MPLQGIERRGELDACIRLGVPLGQGFFLGRPRGGWSGLRRELVDVIRGAAARRVDDTDAVLALVEAAPAVASNRLEDARVLLAGDPALDLVVVLDARRRPVGLDRDASLAGNPPDRVLQLVSPGTAVAELARRMLTREPPYRFGPSVCCDGRGRYVGIVRAERLVEHLVEAAQSR